MAKSGVKGAAFIIQDKNAVIKGSPTANKPSFEERMYSYKAVKSGKNVIIYETFRKGKAPAKRAMVKDSSVPAAIESFRKSNPDHTESARYNIHDKMNILSKIYHRQRPKPSNTTYSTDYVQQQALVYVYNRDTRAASYRVGYSKRQSFYKVRKGSNMYRRGYRSVYPSESVYDEMDMECMQHAILKAAQAAHKYSMMDGYKLSDADMFKEYEASIVERRYIVWKRVIKKNKLTRSISYAKGRDSTQRF